MAVHAWAARFARSPLEKLDYEPAPLAGDEVEIAVTHCGICHSDVHLVDGDWGDHFPVVPGHEVIGTVVAGDAMPPGTRVGVGWQRGSCGRCTFCSAGDEHLCAKSQATCMGNFGGFADRVRAQGRFAIPIPEALPSDTAAPLLCAGITVYSPLRRLVRDGGHVAVIGIGGLGHLALQLAHAMGFEVTAISSRPDKRDDAMRFGAHAFLTGDPPKGTFDAILNTAHWAPDMAVFLRALRPRGVFCQLGAAPVPLMVPVMGLIGGSRSVTGSAIGSPVEIREMLDLAVGGGVRAEVQTMPMSRANEALDRTRRNLARYRMVLEA